MSYLDFAQVELCGRRLARTFPDFAKTKQLGPLLDAVAALRYQSTIVCVPSSELGLTHSLSRKRVCTSPQEPKERGHTLRRVRGWGSPNSDG